MAERDRPTKSNPDDWFAEEKPQVPVRVGFRPSPARADDWLSAGESVRPRRSRLVASPPTLIAAVLLALILLAIGLAAGGVFSGGGGRQAPATTTLPRQVTKPAATRPAAAVQAPTTTLKPGDKGVQVRALQGALALLGYSPGAVDSLYGASTGRAVADFQGAHALTVDGILGPATLAALTSALATRG